MNAPAESAQPAVFRWLVKKMKFRKSHTRSSEEGTLALSFLSYVNVHALRNSARLSIGKSKRAASPEPVGCEACFLVPRLQRLLTGPCENRRTQWRAENCSGPPVLAARTATDEAIGSAFRCDVLRQSTSVMSTDPLAPLERTYVTLPSRMR